MERRAPDSAVADAMNRVLAAEHEASDAIASAQGEAEGLIEAARARRRQILDTARRRASLLHGRSQAQLRQAIEALEGGAHTPGADRGRLRELSRQALENLATRLISTDHESH
jgi:regulator of protease activity HflC (stomatin/prohibitin superfamily)